MHWLQCYYVSNHDIYATACPSEHIFTHPQEECTALHTAADCGHVYVTDILLEAKADPEVLLKVYAHYWHSNLNN